MRLVYVAATLCCVAEDVVDVDDGISRCIGKQLSYHDGLIHDSLRWFLVCSRFAPKGLSWMIQRLIGLRVLRSIMRIGTHIPMYRYMSRASFFSHAPV